MNVAERVMSPWNASAIRSYISLKWTCLLSGSPNGTSTFGSFIELFIAILIRRSSSLMFSRYVSSRALSPLPRSFFR